MNADTEKIDENPGVSVTGSGVGAGTVDEMKYRTWHATAPIVSHDSVRASDDARGRRELNHWSDASSPRRTRRA